MTFDDELQRALETLTDRLRDEIDRQVRAVKDELSASARQQAEIAAAAAVAAIPPPAPPVENVSSAEIALEGALLEGIRALDAAGSLTAVLDTLIGAVAHGETGAGVWLVHGGHLRCWRSRGITAPPDDPGRDEVGLHGEIAEAARTAVPVSRGGFAAPLAISGQVIAVLWASGSSDSSSPLPERTAHPIEILARHAAKCLESMTAFKTARAMADRAAADDRPTTAAAGAHADGDGATTGVEERLAAQRYARLLVSEIKLYHEQAVIEGRRDRDLARRLGGEIARARVMYEQRVPSHVREHADHFRDELVRTLAGGDASLLEIAT
jgi:hypothetical protein